MLFKNFAVERVRFGDPEWLSYQAAETAIIEGDCRQVLGALPADSVDCIVTSPPYWNQRDYGHPGQIGYEQSLDEYVQDLRSVFSKAKSVLKPSGTMWLNLGDKFVDGELSGIPWRVALALKADGWKLRADIIWHKPNAMPSSAKRRPTVDHEYIFLFVKSDDYFFDADGIREPHKTFSADSKMLGGRKHLGVRNGTPEAGKNEGNPNLHNGRWDQAFHPLGRSKRTVWSVPLSKFRGSHFAVFPEKLIETCIIAGCPKNGLILDPFFGSGTTGVVARARNRRAVGIEINAEYCSIAFDRLQG